MGTNFWREIKGHNSGKMCEKNGATNQQNTGGSNPYLDLININAFTKLGEILCISCFHGIERN